MSRTHTMITAFGKNLRISWQWKMSFGVLLPQRLQPLAYPGIGPPLVDNTGEMGDLLGAVLARRRRQHAPLVPAQNRLDRLDERRLPGVIAKGCESDLRFGHREIFVGGCGWETPCAPSYLA